MRDDSSRTPPADRRPAGGGGARRRRRPAGLPVTKTPRPQEEADESPVLDEEDEKILDRVWAEPRQERPAPAGAAGRPRPAATRKLEVAELDTDLRNADWLKTRTWDILPPTTEALLEALDVGGSPQQEQAAAVGRFMGRPAAEAMPPAVRAGLRRLGLLGD